MAALKIYTVRNATADFNAARLVRAPNAVQALRHAAKDFVVMKASQDELVRLLALKVAVEDASVSDAVRGSE